MINKPILEKYFNNIKRVTASDNFDITSSNFTRNNLRGNLRSALRQLQNNNNIIIKEADKYLGIVILDKEWYNNSCLNHLQNTRDYLQINRELFIHKIYPQLIIKYNNILKRISKSNKYYKYLNKNNSNNKYPYFYIIPKVHKPDLSSRPITASHNWVFTPSSAIMADILNPYVEMNTTFLKNSNHLLEIIQPLNSTPHFISYIITGDVESLYTNIPLDSLYNIISNVIKININDISNKFDFDYETIDQLLKLILHESYCEYDKEIYKQTHGIPMGTPCAPQMANLFLNHYEQKISSFSSNLLIWKRYIDDILIIWSGDRDSLQQFLDLYSYFSPSIKISWNIQENYGEFLDLYLIKDKEGYSNNFILNYKTHQKLLNTYLYVPFCSYHRRNVLKGFIKSELNRYKRNSSKESSKESYFLDTKNKFYHRLLARGYPTSFITSIFNSIDYFTLPSYSSHKPTPLSSLFLKIPYNPTTEKLTISSLLQLAIPDINERKEIMDRYSNLIKFKISWLAERHLLSYFNT